MRRLWSATTLHWRLRRWMSERCQQGVRVMFQVLLKMCVELGVQRVGWWSGDWGGDRTVVVHCCCAAAENQIDMISMQRVCWVVDASWLRWRAPAAEDSWQYRAMQRLASLLPCLDFQCASSMARAAVLCSSCCCYVWQVNGCCLGWLTNWNKHIRSLGAATAVTSC
jgi:hypothetical protein